jgi:hypothetical protein
MITQIKSIIHIYAEWHVKGYWLGGSIFSQKINNSRSIIDRVSVFVIGISDSTWVNINNDTGGTAVW